jgi:methylglutaconyl-CoA hydratase
MSGPLNTPTTNHQPPTANHEHYPAPPTADVTLRMSSPDPRQSGDVVAAIRDGTARVRFSHPKSNSLPSALLRRLADEIRRISVDPNVRAIVLSSEGTGAFCAGASFDEMRAVSDAASGREFFLGFAQVILAMTRAPQIVITRVQGKATGGAVGLIAASDYCFAMRGSSLKLSELAVGLGPFVIGPVVERRVGPGPFAAMAIDADWRTAEWAERHGLYARIFDDIAQLDTELEKLAAFVAKANPDAVRQLKQVLWAGTEHWTDLLEKRAAISGALALSPHTRAAIEQFARK